MTSAFHGLATATLTNGHLTLEYLATAGPRLVRLFLPGVEGNLLAEVPNWVWETPYGPFHPYGGHRLWHAPEAMPRTYVPDNEGLTVEPLDDGVRLVGPVEEPTGIRKALEVRLEAGRPALTLCHRLENAGAWPVELAPWAITQLPLGGTAILPQPRGPVDDAGLLPNRHLVLWPYSRWDDQRLLLGEETACVRARPLAAPFKLGYRNDRGWIAYLRAGILFVKRFAQPEGRPYPDRDCNVEVYCDDRVIELETLAPLGRLEPGQTAEHVEQWEVYAGLAPVPQDVRGAIAALGIAVEKTD
jgi:hypothetical protein